MRDIILVDDEEWALQDMKELIAPHAGYRVTGAYVDSRKALDAIIREKPDVVFSDLHMDGLSGRELINEIHACCPKTLMVIISAYSDFDVAREALSRNVVDYLLKPLTQESVDSLFERLNGILLPESAEAPQSPENAGAPERTAAFPHCRVVSWPAEPENRERTLSSLRSAFPDGSITVFRDENGYTALLSTPEPVRAGALSRAHVGASREWKDFSDFDDMRREAFVSRIACFPYQDNALVGSVQSYIALHYRNNITMDGLAARFYISKNHLSNVFNASCSTTVISFLTHIRVAMAAHLLSSTELSIQQVAVDVGYSDSGYFSRVFKKRRSMSPEAYRTKVTGARAPLSE